MPKKGYAKRSTVPRGPGEKIKRVHVWMRVSDIEYVRNRYGSLAEGLRELVTTDRRKFENEHFKLS